MSIQQKGEEKMEQRTRKPCIRGHSAAVAALPLGKSGEPKRVFSNEHGRKERRGRRNVPTSDCDGDSGDGRAKKSPR